MKKLSKVKLNQINESVLSKKDLGQILGGECQGYWCQCLGSWDDGGPGNAYVDESLYNNSTEGYI